METTVITRPADQIIPIMEAMVETDCQGSMGGSQIQKHVLTDLQLNKE